MIRDHTRLRAFMLADEAAVAIYKTTRSFPKEELYGLTSQMRRAAVSVASNIVEGAARSTEHDFLRFLDIAYSSSRELRYQFSLAKRLGYIQNDADGDCELKLEETEKVLGSLIRSLRHSSRKHHQPQPPNPLIP